jgi:hypothetical protein
MNSALVGGTTLWYLWGYTARHKDGTAISVNPFALHVAYT